MGSYGNANLKVKDDDPWCPVSPVSAGSLDSARLRLDDRATMQLRKQFISIKTILRAT